MARQLTIDDATSFEMPAELTLSNGDGGTMIAGPGALRLWGPDRGGPDWSIVFVHLHWTTLHLRDTSTDPYGRWSTFPGDVSRHPTPQAALDAAVAAGAVIV